MLPFTYLLCISGNTAILAIIARHTLPPLHQRSMMFITRLHRARTIRISQFLLGYQGSDFATTQCYKAFDFRQLYTPYCHRLSHYDWIAKALLLCFVVELIRLPFYSSITFNRLITFRLWYSSLTVICFAVWYDYTITHSPYYVKNKISFLTLGFILADYPPFLMNKVYAVNVTSR